MAARKKKAAKTARLNLLIRDDLRKWVHGYASRMDKSVTSIVTEYLIELRARDRRERVHGAEIKQI